MRLPVRQVFWTANPCRNTAQGLRNQVNYCQHCVHLDGTGPAPRFSARFKPWIDAMIWRYTAWMIWLHSLNDDDHHNSKKTYVSCFDDDADADDQNNDANADDYNLPL
jgi:hypothetical protein